MTIASTARKAGPLLGNGSTTSFSFSFKVFATSDIKVAIANSAGVETVLVENTHYTVSLNANQETSPGGIVTYPVSGSPLPSGSVLSIIGDLDYDQPLDLPSGGNFNPLALENQLDRTVMQMQQLKEAVDRSAKLSQTSQADADELSANLMRLAGSADNIDTVATGIAAVNTVADDLNEPVSEINTVAGSIDNVNAVGSNITNVNAVGANIANVNAVAGNATNINAVNANKANIDAVAGNATNINAVNANKTNIDAVAANIADIDAVVTNLTDIQNAPENAALVVDAIAQAVDGEKQLFLAGTNYTKGVTTQLTLTYTPAKSGTVSVIFDGIEQHLTEWSLVGKVITFTAAIPADKVEVRYVVPSQFVGLSGADLTVLGSAQSAAQAGAAVAASAASTAVSAKTAAEAARDAAQLSAGVYATTTAGLAATTTGKYFSVPSADSAEYLILYLNNAGTAVEQKRYPSVSAFDSIYRERFLAARANFLASNVERANYAKRAAILVLVGQSNNVPRGAPISGSVSPDVKMPVGGNSMTYWPYYSTNAEWAAKYTDVASAVTDAQGAAENPGSGMALAMLGGTFSRIYMCSVALGSSSFTRLQSTGPIANCQAVISRLCDIARADGFEPHVMFSTHHGETAAYNGDSEANYYSQGWTYYRQIQAFAAHAMRRMDYDAPILFHMPVAYGTFGTAPNMRNVAKAILRLARDIPGGIMLGGSYQFPITDGVHQSNVGMRKKGELAGQLLRDYFAQRATFQALQMIDAVWSGTTVTVTFNKEIVYDTTLTFGTSLNATNALGGFEFTDDGAFIKINSISVQGRKAVLTLNAVPTGTTQLVQIASQAMTGTPNTFQLTAGSQIRASAAAPLSIYDHTTLFYDMAAPQVLEVRP